MKKLHKKTIGITLVLAILVSVCGVCFGTFSTTASATTTSSTTFDFEHCEVAEYGATNVSISGMPVAVQSDSGNKYLYIPKANGYKNAGIRLFNSNDEAFILKSNTQYIVTFEYKFTGSVNNSFQLKATRFQEGKITNKTAFDNVYTHTQNQGQGTNGSGWYKGEINFTVGDLTGDSKTAFGIQTAGSNSAQSNIYIDNITIKEADNKVAVKFETNGGTMTEETSQRVTKNVPIDMPIPTYADMAFGGWYTDASFSESSKVGATYTPTEDVTFYAKWTNTKARITFNNCGVLETKVIEPGLELPRPKSPDHRLFFEGWYTDVTYTTRVTTATVGTYTLYAKYNGTFISFNNKGWSDTSADVELIADPDDANNNVIKMSVPKNSRPNFALPEYDAVDADFYELKTNTEYFYSFKYKVAPGSVSAEMQLNMGDRSAYKPELYTRSSIPGAMWRFSANTTEENGEWVTVSGSFTTGDTFYLERVKWSYQNHFMFNMWPATGEATIYIDDFIIGTKLTEKPEGATAIYFKTNAEEIDPMYGYEGEDFVLPTPAPGAGCEFEGWYTDIYLTKPFSGNKFGAKDITLYAKWKSSPIIIDFENYNTSIIPGRAKYITDEKGNHLFDIKTEYKPETSFTTLYRLNLNDNGVKYTVTEGETYTVSFEYKLTRGNILYGVINHKPGSAWTNVRAVTGGSDNNADGKWKVATFTFTAANEKGYDKGTWEAFTLGIGGDLDCYVDNVTVSSWCSMQNTYGDSVIKFESNGGSLLSVVSGNNGDQIGKLPTPTRAGYSFNGWYTDAELTTKFNATTFTEGNITLYASWILGKFAEDFEDFPAAIAAMGVSGGYKLYNSEKIVVGFDAANVKSGVTSIFRDGTKTGAKAFTLCRDDSLKLTKGKQYTVSFYVKPSNVTDAAGTISLIGLSKSTSIISPENTTVMSTVGDLKSGEWQKVSYTFTADSPYIGISTTAGNDIYFDNFVISLKGYTGSTTGDSSVSPIIISLMVILAAGALIITGKKVFSK